jgi:acetoin utilization deacetylase AcuC-like enzyme
LVVSAGFDAFEQDPLGGMRVTAGGFAEWGAILGRFADRQCGGRSISLLEGGYNLDALPELVEAYLEGLRGGRT